VVPLQLISHIGAFAPVVFCAPRPAAWPPYFVSPRRRARSFSVAASQRNSCCDRVAPTTSAPGVDVTPIRCHRTFTRKKYRYENPTLQLSSYVVDSRVFHMMRRRFTQVFVASKALNHLQLSLTIARIC